jgi:hypothetical protein
MSRFHGDTRIGAMQRHAALPGQYGSALLQNKSDGLHDEHRETVFSAADLLDFPGIPVSSGGSR